VQCTKGLVTTFVLDGTVVARSYATCRARLSYRRRVRLFVYPSVTRWYWLKLMTVTPSGSPSAHNVDPREHPWDGFKRDWGR